MVDRGRLDLCKDLDYVDARIRSSAPSERIEPLDAEFEPGNWDIICQGGKDSYEHIGNRRFRVCIDNNLETYSRANSKHERSMVVTGIVDAIRECRVDGRGGFIRKDAVSGRWYEVGDKISREKVGHALRDAIKLRSRVSKDEAHASAKSTKRKEPEQAAPPFMLAEDVSSAHKTFSDDKAKHVFDTGKKRRAEVHADTVHNTVIEEDWKKSLEECAEKFEESDDDDDEGSSLDDSPLNKMALQASTGGEATVVEFGHQEYEGNMQSSGIGPLGERVADTSPPKAIRPPVLSWGPPGFAAAENLFADYMERLGLSSAKTSCEKQVASGRTKGPGDNHDTFSARRPVTSACDHHLRCNAKIWSEIAVKGNIID